MTVKKYVILGIVVIIAICGIGTGIYINSYKDADIVFSFGFDYESGEYYPTIVCFIDKNGCIYKTEDREFIEQNIEDFLKNNPNYAEDEKYTLVGKIEEREMKEKIKILKKIAIKGAKAEVKETQTDDYRGEKLWYGYYMKNGKVQVVTLRGEGDRIWINKDSRAEALAEWLSDVFELYDYKYLRL